MTSRISRRFATLVRMAAIALAGVLVLGAGSTAAAQTEDPTLQGTWRVQVTLYNCQTGQKAPPFSSILSFNRGGTMIGNTSNAAFQPGQRTPDLGSWSHIGGNNYQAASEAYILFTSTTVPPAPVFQQGTQRITQAITLNGNQFTSVASVQFFDVSGNLLRAGCATATGQRFN